MTQKSTAHNSTFAIGGVSLSAERFVVAESFVLRINICGKNPAHRKSVKRYQDKLLMHTKTSQNTDIDVSKLPSDIYVIQISNREQSFTITKKLIKIE